MDATLVPSELVLDLSQAHEGADGEQAMERELPEDERFWAARKAEQAIPAVLKKERDYFDALERLGMPRMWRIMRAQYYGLNPDIGEGFETQEIGFDGEQGELLRFRMNEVRSFAKQSITMA